MRQSVLSPKKKRTTFQALKRIRNIQHSPKLSSEFRMFRKYSTTFEKYARSFNANLCYVKLHPLHEYPLRLIVILTIILHAIVSVCYQDAPFLLILMFPTCFTSRALS